MVWLAGLVVSSDFFLWMENDFLRLDSFCWISLLLLRYYLISSLAVNYFLGWGCWAERASFLVYSLILSLRMAFLISLLVMIIINDCRFN